MRSSRYTPSDKCDTLTSTFPKLLHYNSQTDAPPNAHLNNTHKTMTHAHYRPTPLFPLLTSYTKPSARPSPVYRTSTPWTVHTQPPIPLRISHSYSPPPPPPPNTHFRRYNPFCLSSHFNSTPLHTHLTPLLFCETNLPYVLFFPLLLMLYRTLMGPTPP